jgi:DNA-directed RNA polymerase subunit RPC12/RpoP
VKIKIREIKKYGEFQMATYECSKCGMAVNATCAKCNAPLVDDILKLDDGREVQI